MKTITKYILLLLPAFMLAGCAAEDVAENVEPGKGKVTFNVSFDRHDATRDEASALNVNTLLYEMYDSQGEPAGLTGSVDIVDGIIQPFSIDWEGGQYTMVFWAQNSACDLYDTGNLQTVSLDYSKAVNNDDTMDAFYGSAQITIDGDSSATVVLKRPFTQLNIAFYTGGESFTTSQITLSQAYSQLNLMTGAVSGLEDNVVYQASEVPGGTIEINGEEYPYLSKTMVLTGNENLNVNLEMVLEGLDNKMIYTYNDVPLSQNYRANVVGDESSGVPDTQEPLEPIDILFNFGNPESLQQYLPGLPAYTDWTKDGSNYRYVLETPLEYGGISMNFEKLTGTSAPCFYWVSSGEIYDLRVYSGNNFTISVEDGYKLSRITLITDKTTASTFKKISVVTNNNGTWDDSVSKQLTWTSSPTESLSSLTFTPGGTQRIATIQVWADPL